MLAMCVGVDVDVDVGVGVCGCACVRLCSCATIRELVCLLAGRLEPARRSQYDECCAPLACACAAHGPFCSRLPCRMIPLAWHRSPPPHAVALLLAASAPHAFSPMLPLPMHLLASHPHPHPFPHPHLSPRTCP